MVDTQGDSFVPGPLDELVPGLRVRAARWPALVAHPRVSRVTNDAGRDVIVLASFAAAEGPRALHTACKPIVEAALLSTLSQPPSGGRPPLSALELYCFVPFAFDPAPALAFLGFAPRPLGDATRRALALLRREAQLLEHPFAEDPSRLFRAEFAQPTSALAVAAAAALHESPAVGPWGATPGALSRRLTDVLDGLGFTGVEPTRDGIERLESILTHDTPLAIRWIDPLCFQALCDLVAVAAHATWGAQVEWAVCEPDPETGLAPPPLVRVYKHRDRSSGHVPLAEHVLRWAMMPRQPGEQIPTLGAWAEHEFT